MSTKTDRTAWNLTKMAGYLDPMRLENGLYELGKDANMAMIDVRSLDVSEADIPQRYVFVPQKTWDRTKVYERLPREEYLEALRGEAMHWYWMSQMHEF